MIVDKKGGISYEPVNTHKKCAIGGERSAEYSFT